MRVISRSGLPLEIGFFFAVELDRGVIGQGLVAGNDVHDHRTGLRSGGVAVGVVALGRPDAGRRGPRAPRASLRR